MVVSSDWSRRDSSWAFFSLFSDSAICSSKKVWASVFDFFSLAVSSVRSLICCFRFSMAGILRYVGTVQFSQGVWAGIELDHPGNLKKIWIFPNLTSLGFSPFLQMESVMVWFKAIGTLNVHLVMVSSFVPLTLFPKLHWVILQEQKHLKLNCGEK